MFELAEVYSDRALVAERELEKVLRSLTQAHGANTITMEREVFLRRNVLALQKATAAFLAKLERP